jgi:hypothetical protein
MSAATTFNNLPGWAKGAIAVSATAATFYTMYLIYTKIKAINAKAKSQKEVGDVTSDLNSEIQSGKKPTLTASQISGIANELFTAMDGYGTSYEGVLKAIVKVNNQTDLLSVIKSYGVREISSGKYNPEPNFTGTLGQALANELASDERQAVNLMLARKGISHKF